MLYPGPVTSCMPPSSTYFPVLLYSWFFFISLPRLLPSSSILFNFSLIHLSYSSFMFILSSKSIFPYSVPFLTLPLYLSFFLLLLFYYFYFYHSILLFLTYFPGIVFIISLLLFPLLFLLLLYVSLSLKILISFHIFFTCLFFFLFPYFNLPLLLSFIHTSLSLSDF